MDDCRKFRYDFFGEFLSQESNPDNRRNFKGSSNLLPVNHIANDDQQQRNQLQPLDLNKAPTDDSLMEFISDYFQGI